MVRLRNSVLGLQIWFFIQVAISVFLVVTFYKEYHFWIVIPAVIALIFPLLLVNFASSVIQCMEELSRDSKNGTISSHKSYKESIDILNR